jgi:hypothetical protein
MISGTIAFDPQDESSRLGGIDDPEINAKAAAAHLR